MKQYVNHSRSVPFQHCTPGLKLIVRDSHTSRGRPHQNGPDDRICLPMSRTTSASVRLLLDRAAVDSAPCRFGCRPPPRRPLVPEWRWRLPDAARRRRSRELPDSRLPHILDTWNTRSRLSKFKFSSNFNSLFIRCWCTDNSTSCCLDSS